MRGRRRPGLTLDMRTPIVPTDKAPTTLYAPPEAPPGPAQGAQPAAETVDHPLHYNAHPSGVECIQVVEHMGFNLGNAIKYIWRADEKGRAVEDLRKARWYLDRELARREGAP